MTVLVNGRVIRNQVLNKVINDSYSSFKEDTRYPIVVIKIDTDPSLIDVNIHPSKQDIKFSNFEDLKTLISTLIVDTIKTKLLIPKIEVKEEPPKRTTRVTVKKELEDTKEFEKVSPEEKTIDEALNGGKDISADEDNDIFNLIDSMYEGDE